MNDLNASPDERIVDEPTQRILIDIAKRLPAYLRLGTRLMRDERIPKRHKATLTAALGYTISPIDLIPGIIPLLGQLDDLLVLLSALRFTLNHIDPALAEEHSRELEAEAAAAISEVRQAAADWLRDQTKSIRAEAERDARAGESG